jgi:hypothetical protein
MNIVQKIYGKKVKEIKERIIPIYNLGMKKLISLIKRKERLEKKIKEKSTSLTTKQLDLLSQPTHIIYIQEQIFRTTLKETKLILEECVKNGTLEKCKDSKNYYERVKHERTSKSSKTLWRGDKPIRSS